LASLLSLERIWRARALGDFSFGFLCFDFDFVDLCRFGFVAPERGRRECVGGESEEEWAGREGLEDALMEGGRGLVRLGDFEPLFVFARDGGGLDLCGGDLERVCGE